MAEVLLEQVSKHFFGPGRAQVRALTNLSLSVQEDEFMVIVGPSGSGKTTTLRLIAGLEEPTSGTIFMDGQPINHRPPRERDIAMVSQSAALYPHMTVRENIGFGLKLRKVSRAEIVHRTQEAAEMLDLLPLLDRLPETLSGGERQRVALGRALVRRPKAFLLDEPLSNLDSILRTQMRANVARLHQQIGGTMIYVTHDQEEAMSLGDRLAVMRDGVLQQLDRPMQVYHHPANAFVAGFVGSPAMNFFEGTIVGEANRLFFEAAAGAPSLGRLPVPGGTASLLAPFLDKRVTFAVRPEDVLLGPENVSAEGCFSAVVELIEHLGWETHVHLVRGPVRFVARVQGSPAVGLKSHLNIAFDMPKAHFLTP